MKKAFWYHIFLLVVITSCHLNTYGVPASRQILTINQPDGTKLDIKLMGDEFFHYALSSDGYVLIPDDKGFYNYGVKDSTGTVRAGNRIARNTDKRTDADRIFLKTIKPGLSFSKEQMGKAMKMKIQKASIKNTALRSAKSPTTGLISTYPTQGSPKSLVIMVNFSDIKFRTADSAAVYSNMLNQEGYNDGLQNGSVYDYYKFNSGGIFKPNYVVVGPVTLDKTMSYYGHDSIDDEDAHPAEMVYDACLKIASSVDFSDFDYDNDGYVDNIYVYYAGKGEADGGGVNTIWPHSWVLSGDNLSLKLNNKTIDAYACSSELTGSGIRAGIGTFSHEYGHILGLPDFYDTDYNTNGQGFDIEEWSLMAYGAYNGNGYIPPCLTILERKLLGWATPAELNNRKSVSMPDFGSTNQGYIIKTDDPDEYFLLENRQRSVNHWDSALPYHGLLIYHVDMRDDYSIYVNSLSSSCSPADLWNKNMVNAISSHQCADIEEADNVQYNSTAGDPFPGLKKINSFTDNTIPSMKTWNDTKLNMPITTIRENDGNISFDFMAGNDFTQPPFSLQAINIKPFQFTAKWASAEKASGYYLDVYKQEISSGDTVRSYVSGYNNLYLEDTTSVVYVPDDVTHYLYCVRATNNYAITPSSIVASALTTDGTPSALPATDVNSFKFTANWKVEDWAVGYYLDVFKMEETENGDSILSYIDGYKNKYLTDSAIIINELDDQTSYGYRIRAATGYADTRNSNTIKLVTPKASAIVPYFRDKTIYLKGIDHGSIVKVYNLLGVLCKTTNDNQFTMDQSGIYLIEAYMDGKKNIVKILVQ